MWPGCAAPKLRWFTRGLGAISKALLRDDAELAYLFDIAHAASPVGRPRRVNTTKLWKPHESLQWILDSVTAGPAFVRNGRLDLLATNRFARRRISTNRASLMLGFLIVSQVSCVIAH